MKICDEALDIPRCNSTFITCVSNNTSIIITVQRLDNLNKINSCFIWVDEWAFAVNALLLLKDSDINFSKKIKVIDNQYDKNADEFSKSVVKSKTIEFKKYVDVKCLTL